MFYCELFLTTSSGVVNKKVSHTVIPCLILNSLSKYDKLKDCFTWNVGGNYGSFGPFARDYVK